MEVTMFVKQRVLVGKHVREEGVCMLFSRNSYYIYIYIKIMYLCKIWETGKLDKRFGCRQY